MEMELFIVAALHFFVRIFVKFGVVLHLGVSYVNIRARDWFRPF